MTEQRIDTDLIQRIADRIADALHPRRIVLFGSRARGDNRDDSDIDLFIEMESDEPQWKRRQAVDRLFPERWWPMDLYVITPTEFEGWRNSLATILPDIQREGKLLYKRG